MTSVKDTVIRQYARQLDGVAQQLSGLSKPKDGWIATMRKALGMSAPELARRTGVTKPAIYQAERKERAGGISLQHMEKLAEAMGGRFGVLIDRKGKQNNVTALDKVFPVEVRREGLGGVIHLGSPLM